ncbi:Ig-like domain-containing protein [Halioxenophilus aromaticivorans]|uniref:Uncharacterized protein n=1 Tax=Halioxenophilus aromaticivorans TaxID=1306992 RepID=A0AAV3U6Z2_9ALTE
MKKHLTVLASALALASAELKADFPNQASSSPGKLISKSHPELGRLSTIDVLGDYIIAIPEQPSAPEGSDFIVRAIDISDPKNPRTVATFGTTKHPMLAHGTYKRGNQLYLGGWPTDAVTLENDGSLTHERWEGWDVKEFGKTGGQYPWAVKNWWSYNPVSGNAYIKKHNKTLAEWDHLGLTGVVGFPTVVGNVLLYGSDQSMSGAAAYDISDPTNPVLLDVLKLPEQHPTLSVTKWKNGSTEQTPLPYGLGGYWHEIHSHYMVFARRHENPGIQVVDFSDPTNLKLHCDVFFKDPKHGLTNKRGTHDPMYLNFQDEYVFAEKLKVNIETCEVEQYFDELEAGIETNQYSRPIGNLLLTGGGNNYLIEGSGGKPGGLGIWAHQSQKDTRPPYVAYHIPKANQTNYPVGAPITLMIPETLHSTTITAGETLKLTKVGGGEVAIDYVLTHAGLLTVSPLQDLEANSTYEMELAGIEDAVHNKMERYTFRFATGSSVNDDDKGGDTGGGSGGGGSGGGGGNDNGSDPVVVETNTAPVINNVNVGPSSTAVIGDSVTVSVNASDADGDALQYRFRKQDGEEYSAWTSSSSASFNYSNVGSYSINVQVKDGNGAQVTSVAHVAVVQDMVLGEASLVSGPMALSLNGDFIWVANPDNDTISKISTSTHQLLAEIPVGKKPTSIAMDKHNRAWITLKDEDAIAVVDQHGGRYDTHQLDYGSAPVSVVFNREGTLAFVALANSGEVIKINRWTKEITGRVAGITDPKAMALTHDESRLLVTRFTSGQHWGEVYELNTTAMTHTNTIRLEESLVPDDLDNGRGVPNYLASIIVDGSDQYAYVVGKKDNTARGLLNGNGDLDDDNSVRTFIGKIDLASGTEVRAERLDFDNADSPSGLAISDNGQYVFAALQGNNQIAVLSRDTTNGKLLGTVSKLATGLAPQGLLFDAASQQLFVKNFTDRSVSTVDLAQFLTGSLANPAIVETVTVGNEKLSAQELQGKQIFYNAAHGLDEEGQVTGRTSAEGYLSCATCHFEGGQDNRVYDFTGRGEGLRNNISLVGRMGTRYGNVHWSGNFDEIQDFENDMRHNFLGRGLMSNSSFAATEDPLGSPKAGQSAELDALAAYVESLGKATLDRSPFRDSQGQMSSAAKAGEQVFSDLGCSSCHAGKGFTDGELHNVGTLREYSGKRLHASLPGISTPSLLGVFKTAPYLHDGSAATLEDVFKLIGGRVFQAEDANLSGGASVVTPAADFSHYRKGVGVQLTAGSKLALTARSNPHTGIVRVRYSTAAANATLQLKVNGTSYSTKLATLPTVDGLQTAFEEAIFTAQLGSGFNNIEVSFTSANGNDKVYVDDLTVSRPWEQKLSLAHTKVQTASATQRSNLMAYLKQLDQASAPEDDEAVKVGSAPVSPVVDDAPKVDVCGRPSFSFGADKGAYVWKDCEQAKWFMYVSPGGTSIDYSGSISSSTGFTATNKISFERHDTFNASAQLIEFRMRAWGSSADGIAVSVADTADACFNIDTSNAKVYLGPQAVEMSQGFDLNSLQGCD